MKFIYHSFIIIGMDGDLFTIQICYGGFIKYHPHYHYSGGSIKYFDNRDPVRFSNTEPEDILAS